MLIHVVRAGDTLDRIAQTYGVSENELASADEVPDPQRLVLGQTLVIPVSGRYYWVQPGETLWKISRRYGVSVDELIRLNRLANPGNIKVGTRLYLPEREKPAVDVNAYINPGAAAVRAAQEVNRVGTHLTFLSVFSYQVSRDGSLIPLQDQPIINAARNHRVLPLLVLTNLENGQFSTSHATAILTNEFLQERILDQAVQLMAGKGYRGLDIDFEYLGRENRERYVSFLQKAASRLKPLGYSLTVALAPKNSADQKGVLYEGHDYPAIGRIVDRIFCMTYEWGWSGGSPMAVSPLNNVRQVLKYAVSAVPKEKVMMGIPLYGYDWTLPYEPGGKFAASLSPQRALRLALYYRAESINYNQKSQAPWFRYLDEQGQEHEVWFEDARSIQAKFDLVKQLGIGGFYYWVLGNDFPQNWLLVEDNFTVRKRE